MRRRHLEREVVFDPPPSGERRRKPLQGPFRNGHYPGAQSSTKPLLPSRDEHVRSPECGPNGTEPLNAVDEHRRVPRGFNDVINIDAESRHVVDEAHGNDSGFVIDRRSECFRHDSAVRDLDRTYLRSAGGFGAKPWISVRWELV